MFSLFAKFRSDEHGAVTVDWVVLTAVVASIAGIAFVSIGAGVEQVSTSTKTYVNNAAETIGELQDSVFQ
ncbi:hypothetical protein [Leisingera sp. JC1]|uniref:hypothetical protein n=1 Tax=Leisingera sp. JC1 TaxID=1855282 RepID=UPI000802A76A|nr:hypothetical protein [Leisingera sp. JC1]OBY26213.1 hypothetical protein A9D60_19360 [Leisingera sp. JC1]